MTASRLTTARRAAAGQAPPGLAEAIREVVGILGDDAYPCMYATAAVRQDSLLFAPLAWDGDPARARELAETVDEYLRVVAGLPPGRAAMTVLVVLVDVPGDPRPLEPVTWEIVRALIDADPAGAAAAGPVDSPSWALTFRGVRLFVNVSSPEHVLRRSRNLGSRLALVVQPRDGIDFVAPPDETGDRTREAVRRRVDGYDLLPRSPDLATHGNTANRDWKQYWLVDSPDGWTGRCPLADLPAAAVTE